MGRRNKTEIEGHGETTPTSSEETMAAARRVIEKMAREQKWSGEDSRVVLGSLGLSRPV